MSDGEHIETFGSSLRLIVSDRYTFGTDALLLAYFSAPRTGDAMCDLGTGCGVIPFCWLRDGARRVYAVELQKDACAQLSRSVALNGLEERLTLLNADVRALRGLLPANAFDLTVMNPPYTPLGRGLLSGSEEARIARHETDLTPEELCAAAARLLKFGGRFCLCQRPERLTDYLCAMRAARIEPKRLRFVARREGKKPWLFLLEGKRGRNPGLTAEPELHLETPDGSPTEEARRIYGSYAADRLQERG